MTTTLFATPIDELGPNTKKVLEEKAYDISTAFKESVIEYYTDEKGKQVILHFTLYGPFIDVYKVINHAGCIEPTKISFYLCRKEFGERYAYRIKTGDPNYTAPTKSSIVTNTAGEIPTKTKTNISTQPKRATQCRKSDTGRSPRC